MRVRGTLALVLTLAGVWLAAPSAAQAAPSCRADAVSTSLLAIDLPLLVANAPASPCLTRSAGTAVPANLNVLGTLRADAVIARTAETPTTGPSDRRARTAFTRVAGLSANLLPVALLPPLLTVDVAESSVEARCVAGAPSLQGRTEVQGVRLFGQAVTVPVNGVVNFTSDTINGLGLGQVARITTGATTESPDGRTGTSTALRLEVLSGLGTLVDLTVGQASASVDGVDCAVVAPTVVVDAGGANRAVSATVTPGTRPVASGTLEVRPQGSTGAFTTVPSTYDPVTKQLRATLPRSGYAPGAYEVRATVVDADGRDAVATGTATVARPTVGSPAVSGRTLTAAAAPPAGTTLASCAFTLTAGGQAPVQLPGTLSAGACTATVPDAVAAGPYVLDVTVTDGNGDTATQSANGTVGAVPAGPGVQIVASANRTVVAPTTAGDGGPATSCTVVVRPAGQPAPATTRPGTLTDGRCGATLPRADFPVGSYDVTVTVRDGAGREATATSTVAVTGPVVGPISVDDRAVSAPVQLPAGTSAASCTVTLADQNGQVLAVAGTVSGAVCRATVPSSVAAGAYDVTVEAVDSNGDRGTLTRTGVAVGTPGTAPAAPTVTPVGSGVNRVAAVDVVAPAGETIAACSATTTVGGADVSLATSYDAMAGRCIARLPAGDFDAGDRTVTFAVTASGGGTTTRPSTVTVGAPVVGAPAGDGRDVAAPVTPAPGVALASCVVRFAAGASVVQVPGTLQGGTCRATAPAALPDGNTVVTVTVSDVNGDTASQTRTIALAGPGGGPDGGGGGGGDGAGGGTGGQPTTPTTPATPATPARPAPGNPFSTSLAADLLTGCDGRRLVLVSVYRVGGGVLLRGVANRALAGQRVLLRATGRRAPVARPVVDPQGDFSARVSMRGLRRGTRFVASVGKQRSLALKLTRRLQVGSAVFADGKVTARGLITTPRPPAGAKIEVRRLVSCGTYEKEGTVRMTKRGRFVARITPPDARVAIYRFVATVPRRPGDTPRTRTYSLPVVVSLR